MGSPTTYLSIMISRSAIYLYYYKVEPLVPRVPLKRWSVTHSVIVNTTTCCYAYVIKKIRTRKYGKPLIQKTQIWETFDTESITPFPYTTGILHTLRHWAPQPWLPFSGLARSAGTVVFPLGLSESVLVFLLTARLTLHLFRRYSCSLLFRSGCQVCFVLL